MRTNRFLAAIAPLLLQCSGPSGTDPAPASPVGGGAPAEDVASSPSAGGTPTPPSPLQLVAMTASWPLVFADEFDGGAVDETKWTIRTGYQGHSTDLNVFARDCVSVHDGSLFITAKPSSDDPTHPYASGRIDGYTRFATSFGRVDVRARFPAAHGVWFAIWARPNAQPYPELDIEILNQAKPQVWLVDHWGAPDSAPDHARVYTTLNDVDITTFHVYSIVSTSTQVTWFIDGAPWFDAPPQGIPQTPLFWTINGWVGGWSGEPDATTPFPLAFEVDYFRYYAAPLP